MVFDQNTVPQLSWLVVCDGHIGQWRLGTQLVYEAISCNHLGAIWSLYMWAVSRWECFLWWGTGAVVRQKRILRVSWNWVATRVGRPALRRTLPPWNILAAPPRKNGENCGAKWRSHSRIFPIHNGKMATPKQCLSIYNRKVLFDTKNDHFAQRSQIKFLSGRNFFFLTL